jgi:hypothetical protein
MGESWFSASLRFATNVGDEVPTHEDSVIVFRASDWAVALQRAVGLGHEMEQRYKNIDQVPIERRLVEVRTLDELGASISDGREVYCAPAESAGTPPPRPEDSRPDQTGV